MSINVLVTPCLLLLFELPAVKGMKAYWRRKLSKGEESTREMWDQMVDTRQQLTAGVLMGLTIAASFCLWSPLVLLFGMALSPVLLLATKLALLMKFAVRKSRRMKRCNEWHQGAPTGSNVEINQHNHEQPANPAGTDIQNHDIEDAAITREQLLEDFGTNLCLQIKVQVPNKRFCLLQCLSMWSSIMLVLLDYGFGIVSLSIWCCMSVAHLALAAYQIRNREIRHQSQERELDNVYSDDDNKLPPSPRLMKQDGDSDAIQFNDTPKQLRGADVSRIARLHQKPTPKALDLNPLFEEPTKTREGIACIEVLFSRPIAR